MAKKFRNNIHNQVTPAFNKDLGANDQVDFVKKDKSFSEVSFNEKS